MDPKTPDTEVCPLESLPRGLVALDGLYGVTHLRVTHKMTKLFLFCPELGNPGSCSDTPEPGDPGKSLLRACVLTVG